MGHHQQEIHIYMHFVVIIIIINWDEETSSLLLLLAAGDEVTLLNMRLYNIYIYIYYYIINIINNTI